MYSQLGLNLKPFASYLSYIYLVWIRIHNTLTNNVNPISCEELVQGPPSASSSLAGEENDGGGGDCLYCDQTFPGRPDQLAVHLAQHASCLEARCDLCGATLTTDLHVHAGECSGRQLVIAGAGTEEQASPEAPESRAEAGGRIHVCQVCEKPFKSASHLRVHSGTGTTYTLSKYLDSKKRKLFFLSAFLLNAC